MEGRVAGVVRRREDAPLFIQKKRDGESYNGFYQRVGLLVKGDDMATKDGDPWVQSLWRRMDANQRAAVKGKVVCCAPVAGGGACLYALKGGVAQGRKHMRSQHIFLSELDDWIKGPRRRGRSGADGAMDDADSASGGDDEDEEEEGVEEEAPSPAGAAAGGGGQQHLRVETRAGAGGALVMTGPVNIARHLGMLALTAGMAYSLLSSRPFYEYSRRIAQSDFQMVSADTITRSADKAFKDLQAVMKRTVSTITVQTPQFRMLNIVVDGGQARSSRPVIGVAVSGFTAEGALLVANIGCKRFSHTDSGGHTAEGYVNRVEEILDEYIGINVDPLTTRRVFFATHDSASVNNAAFNYKNGTTQFQSRSMPCVAHRLSNFVKDVAAAVPQLTELIEEANRISTFFKPAKRFECLDEVRMKIVANRAKYDVAVTDTIPDKRLEFRSDVKTRFYSSILVISRVEQWLPVILAANHPQLITVFRADAGERDRIAAISRLAKNVSKNLVATVKIRMVLHDAYAWGESLAGRKYVTLDKIPVMIASIRNSIAAISDVELKRTVATLFQKRIKGYEDDTAVRMASVLGVRHAVWTKPNIDNEAMCTVDPNLPPPGPIQQVLAHINSVAFKLHVTRAPQWTDFALSAAPESSSATLTDTMRMLGMPDPDIVAADNDYEKAKKEWELSQLRLRQTIVREIDGFRKDIMTVAKAEAALDCPIAGFWQAHKAAYPHLWTVARLILAIPATAVPVESLFSTMGYVYSLRRSRLTPARLEASTLTRTWVNSEAAFTAVGLPPLIKPVAPIVHNWPSPSAPLARMPDSIDSLFQASVDSSRVARSGIAAAEAEEVEQLEARPVRGAVGGAGAVAAGEDAPAEPDTSEAYPSEDESDSDAASQADGYGSNDEEDNAAAGAASAPLQTDEVVGGAGDAAVPGASLLLRRSARGRIPKVLPDFV